MVGPLQPFLRAKRDRQFNNDKAGRRARRKWLRKHGVQRAVFEPTGRHHRQLHQCLFDSGMQTVLVNPLRSRRFADRLAGVRQAAGAAGSLALRPRQSCRPARACRFWQRGPPSGGSPGVRSADKPPTLAWVRWPLGGVGDRARAGPSATESSMACRRTSASPETPTSRGRVSWHHGVSGERWIRAWAEP
ncbi:MAG: hypothetical protein OXN89_20790 [Bryobacterales bacterium]|nr:hypothetical protein [Bryobacterales bacterium]